MERRESYKCTYNDKIGQKAMRVEGTKNNNGHDMMHASE